MEYKQLPKNIRQIGQVVREPKVYIEDYVVTFARKLSEKSKNGWGMAVLLGKTAEKKSGQPTFIKGAVEVCGLEEGNENPFNNEIWSNIYEGVKNYFPDLEIVGFMILRSGQEAGFDEKVKKLHENNFTEGGDILFVFDREEKEESIYHYENQSFEKQTGYYIYYEKNEAMQSYMIDTFGNHSHEAVGEDKVMEQVRELVAAKENNSGKRVNHLMYAASTALAAVVLVIGVTSLNNYGKMESMEQTLNHISANMEQEKEVGNADEENMIVEMITGHADQLDQKEDMTEDVVEEDEEVMAGKYYYIVQKGDTLGSISNTVYGSVEYIEMIREANQIENRDRIYEGQKLIMP